MSKALSKYIEELLFKVPEMMKIANGEQKLTPEDGAAVYRLKRVEEVSRIVESIRKVYDSLEDEKQDFLNSYFWESGSKTLGAAGRDIYISENTAKRWKKEIVCSVAKQLGWL